MSPRWVCFPPKLLLLFAPRALLLYKALTLIPDKHMGLELEVCGVCIDDSSQDVMEGGVTDLPDFLCCEQPGEKRCGATGVTGWQQEGFTPCTVLGTEEAGGCFFSSSFSFCVILGLAEQ